MDRADAERVFALVAAIGGDLRDRIVSERWWLAWLAVGIDMLVFSTLLQAMLWHGERRLSATLALIVLNVAALTLVVQFIRRRAGGQRSAIERCLWWIWTTHLACNLGVLMVERLYRLEPFTLAPVFALFGAGAFSHMAMLTHRFFLLHAAVFGGVALAMAVAASHALWIYGTAWFACSVSISLFYRLWYAPCATRRL
jgi:hypothetical protein